MSDTNTTPKGKDFDALEHRYRAAQEWGKLADLYQKSGLASDRKVAISRLSAAGTLYQEKLKDAKRAQECFQQCVSTLKKAVEETKSQMEQSDLLCDLGKIQLEFFKDREKAIEAYVRAFELDPQKTHLMGVLGNIYSEKEGWNDVAKRFNSEAKGATDPKLRAKYLESVADIYSFILTEPEKAASMYRDILKMDPTNRKAIDALESLLIKGRKWGDLVEFYLEIKAHTTDKDDTVSLCTKLGLIYKDKLAQPLEAIQIYEELISIQPNNFRIAAKLEELRGDREGWDVTMSTLQDQLRKAKEPKERVPILLRQSLIAEAYLHQSKVAVEKASEALRLAPGHSDALRRAVSLWVKTHSYPEIAQAYERAAQESPTQVLRAQSWRELAKISLEKLNDPTRAIAALESLLQVIPKDEAAREQLATLYESQRLWGSLERLLETNVETATSERQQTLLLRLAKLREEELGNPEGAIDAYEKLAELDTHHPDALLALERLYPQERRWEKLVDVYERRAEQLATPYEKGALYLAQARTLEERVGNLKEAAKAYERALLLVEDPGPISSRVEQIYFSEKMWEDLAGLYRRTLARIRTPEEQIKVLFKLSELYEQKLNQIENAKTCLATILERKTGDLLALRKLENIYERQKQWEELIDIYRQEFEATQDLPEKVAVYLKAGEVFLHRLKDERRAEGSYRRVLDLDPTNRVAIDFLTEFYRKVDRNDELLHILEARTKVTTEAQPLSRLYFEIAQLLETSLRREADAVGFFEKAVELDPNMAEARKALARIYGLRGRWAELVKTYIRELDLSKDRLEGAELAARIGRLYQGELQDPAAAIPFFQRSLELNPSNSSCLRDLTRAFEQTRQFAQAIPCYEQIVILSDTGEEETTACLRLGELYTEVHQDRGRAAEWYEKALAADSNSQAALDRLTHLYEELEQWDGLLRIYERTLTALKGHEAATMHFRIGELYRTRLHTTDRALVSYQIASELDPHFIAPLSAMRRILKSEENWGEYLKVTQTEAELTRSPQEKALLLFETGRLWRERFLQTDRSIHAFEEVLSLSPKNLQALEQLSSLYAESHDYDNCLRVSTLALESATDPIRRMALLERLGQMYLKQKKDFTNAAKTYREILAIDPKHRSAILQLAEVCAISKDYKGQLNALQMRLEIEETPTTKVEVLFQMAQLWRGPLSSLENATETLHALLRLDPSNVPALAFLGEVATEGNQWHKVAHQILKGLSESKKVEAHVAAALVVAKTYSERFERVDRAIAAIMGALESAGDRPDLLEALIGLYEKTGEALAMADVALRRAKFYEDPVERAKALIKVADTWSEALDNPRQAIGALEQAQKLDPGSPELVDRLVRLFLRIGDWAAANRLLEETLGSEALTSSRSQDLAFQRATLLAERLSLPDLALKILEQILSQAADHRPSLTLAVALYEAKKDFKHVAKTKERLAEITHGSESIDIRRSLATLYEVELNDSNRAVAQYETILKIVPRDRSSLATLERLHEGRNDFVALSNALQQQIALARDDKDMARLYRKLGEVWRDHLKDPKKAIDFFQRSLEKNPSQVDVCEFLISAHRTAKRSRDLAEVLELRAKQLTPEQSIPMYEELADLWLESLNNPIRALEFLDHTLKIQPDRRSTLKRMSHIHERNENFRALGWTLRRLAETANTPDEQVEAWLALGGVQQGNLASPHEAIETYRKILKLQPGQTKALERLRDLFGRDERWGDLAEVLRKLAREVGKGSSASILKELARIELDRLRQPALALNTFELIYKLTPTDPEVAQHLENLYERHGKFPELAKLLEAELNQAIPDEKKVPILHRLGSLYDDRLHKDDLAILCYEKILTTTKADMQALSRLESLYRKAGRQDDAGKILESHAMLLPHGGERTSLLDSLAYRHWSERKNVLDAIRCYLALAEDPKEKRRAYERMATIYSEKNMPSELASVLRLLIVELSEPKERVPRLLQLGQLEHGSLANLAEAERVFKEVLTLAPHQPDAVEHLKTLYEDSHAWKKVVELLTREEQATKDLRRRTKMLRELAEIWRGPLRDPTHAVSIYEELVRIAPHEMDAVGVLAELYFEKGALKEAAPLYDRLVKVSASRKDPAKAAKLFYQLGTIARKLNNTDEAIIHFNQSLSYDGNYLESIRALADLFYDMGQWDNALTMLQKVIKLGRPEDRAYIDQHYYRLLQTLDRLKSYDEALRIYEEAKEQLRNHLGALKLAGELYFRASKWRDAREIYDRILHLSKTAADKIVARHVLADLSYHHFKDAKTARDHLQHLFKDDPHHKGGLELYYSLCAEAKEWPDAIHTLEQLSPLETDPGKLSLIYFRLGEIHDRETGDLRKARESYLKSIEVSQGETPAMAALANFCKSDDDWKDLAALYEKTIAKLKKKENPQQAANFQLALGHLYLNHLRDINHALESYRQALALDPSSEGALLSLARGLAKSPKTLDEAHSIYDRLIGLNPLRSDLLREVGEAYGHERKEDALFLYRLALTSLGEATSEEKAYVTQQLSRMKPLLDPRRAVDWREIVDLFPLETQSPLAKVFASLGEALIPICTSGGRSAAMLSATDVVPGKTTEAISEFCKRLELDAKRIGTYYSSTLSLLELELTVPPALGVGPALYKLDSSVQRFLIAYQVCTLRLGFRLLSRLSKEAAEELVDALSAVAFERPGRREGSASIIDSIRRTLSKKDIKLLSDTLRGVSQDKSPSLPLLLQAMESSALRLALLLVDDPLSSLAGAVKLGPEKQKDLLLFLLSPAYRMWRDRRLAS